MTAVTLPTFAALAIAFFPEASALPGSKLPSVGPTAGALNDTDRAPGPVPPVVSEDCIGDVEYCPSEIQLMIDRSFSTVPMDSLLTQSIGRLSRTGEGPCGPQDECEWRDANGVRHFPWGETQANMRIVIKFVDADTFIDRPINALGIGMARRRDDVLSNIRRFAPTLQIDCDPDRVSGNVGPVECGATLNPGWVQIGFDHDGNLLRIRFDAYQFT